MLDRVKKSLLFAFFCSVGATLGCLIMGVCREPTELLRFFAIEIPIAFAFHILLTLLLEKLRSRKS